MLQYLTLAMKSPLYARLGTYYVTLYTSYCSYSRHNKLQGWKLYYPYLYYLIEYTNTYLSVHGI